MTDKRTAMSDLLRLLPYSRPYARRIAVTVVIMLVGTAISIVLPLISRLAIDVYVMEADYQGLIRVILGAGGLFILMNGIHSLRARIMARVGQETIKAIRTDLFVQLQTLPVQFFDKIPVGKVVTRLTSDVDAVSELVSNAIINLVVDSLKLVGFLAFMLYLDYRLTLITMAFLPLLVFAMTILNQRIRKAEDAVREQASVVNASVQETMSGIKVIQAFGAEEHFADTFAVKNRQLLVFGNRAVATFAFFWPVVDLSWILSVAALVFFGGRWVIEGTTTIGTLIAFFAYNGQFFGPLRGLSQAYRIIQRALAGAVRINEIFASAPEVDTGLPPMPPVRGSVEFRSVTFGYEDDEMVLENIDITVNPGETIALVGHTGAGKTSIINLLCRFYSPQRGEILVDGMNIAERELTSYRRQIGLVLQDPFLFSGPLRENLRFGAPQASDEEMWRALTAVGLRTALAEHGLTLDYVLTERGSNFSSGQRQLISFARALLADPRILILDEATAYVDTLTEQKIQTALRTLLQGRTSFVIAHRLSTIRSADRILVIGHGAILESGTHDELLDRRGEYWQLCQAQLSPYTGDSSVV